MPDITMCNSINCKERYECYRYMALPDKHRQSISNFYEELKTQDKCEWFFNIGNRKIRSKSEMKRLEIQNV